MPVLGGSSGGTNGFAGQWAAGTYTPGQMVARGNYLMAARNTTSADPLPTTNEPAMSDTSATGWQYNGAAVYTSPDAVLNNGGTSTSASIVSKTAESGWNGKTLVAEVYLAGGADALSFGLLDAAAAVTTLPAAGGPPGSIWGAYLNIYNNQVSYLNGSGGVSGTVSADPRTVGAAYEKWYMQMIDLGANWQLNISRQDGNFSLTSWTYTKPTFTSWRFMICSWSGGTPGTFKVHSASNFSVSTDWRRIGTLVDKT